MIRSNEKGESKLGGYIWLILILAMAYAGWNVAPVYMANYVLKDKMIELARLPRSMNKDEKIMDRLMKEVQAQGLSPYVKRQDVKIITSDASRRIVVEYERTEEVLPGWNKTFVFKNEVDQPLVF